MKAHAEGEREMNETADGHLKDLDRSDLEKGPSEDVLISHWDVANLAYHLWEERGCPDGSADEDWFEAERRVKGGPA
jgi:hypothetical protein